MAKTTLTDSYIRNRERPAKGNVIDYDDVAKGLSVRFTSSGVPTFLFCYGSGVAGGSARRMVIGPWSEASGQSAASIIPKLRRSEEHTSELQSLIRTSYAVLCLIKKNNTNA